MQTCHDSTRKSFALDLRTLKPGQLISITLERKHAGKQNSAKMSKNGDRFGDCIQAETKAISQRSQRPEVAVENLKVQSLLGSSDSL